MKQTLPGGMPSRCATLTILRSLGFVKRTHGAQNAPAPISSMHVEPGQSAAEPASKQGLLSNQDSNVQPAQSASEAASKQGSQSNQLSNVQPGHSALQSAFQAAGKQQLPTNQLGRQNSLSNQPSTGQPLSQLARKASAARVEPVKVDAILPPAKPAYYAVEAASRKLSMERAALTLARQPPADQSGRSKEQLGRPACAAGPIEKFDCLPVNQHVDERPAGDQTSEPAPELSGKASAVITESSAVQSRQHEHVAPTDAGIEPLLLIQPSTEQSAHAVPEPMSIHSTAKLDPVAEQSVQVDPSIDPISDGRISDLISQLQSDNRPTAPGRTPDSAQADSKGMSISSKGQEGTPLKSPDLPPGFGPALKRRRALPTALPGQQPASSSGTQHSGAAASLSTEPSANHVADTAQAPDSAMMVEDTAMNRVQADSNIMPGALLASASLSIGQDPAEGATLHGSAEDGDHMEIQMDASPAQLMGPAHADKVSTNEELLLTAAGPDAMQVVSETDAAAAPILGLDAIFLPMPSEDAPSGAGAGSELASGPAVPGVDGRSAADIGYTSQPAAASLHAGDDVPPVQAPPKLITASEAFLDLRPAGSPFALLRGFAGA